MAVMDLLAHPISIKAMQPDNNIGAIRCLIMFIFQ